MLTDLDLFYEFINLYENDEEKLISFSAMTLKEEYEELVKGFLAKFSTEIYQSESKFFEFQKKIDFKIPDDFCKLFLRYNLVKLISLNPDLEFNRLDYYYDILFQIISSSEVKNISGLKKSLPKNELDVDLKKIVAAINNPYPY